MSQSIRHSFLVDGQFATSTESQALAPMDDKIHITTDEPSWGKMEGLDSIPFPSLSLGEGETIGTPSSEGSEVSALEPPPESPVLDHEFSRVLQPEFKFQLAPEFLPEPISLAFHAASDRIFVGNRWSQAIECFSPLGHRVPLARPPVCDEPHTKYSFQIAVHPTKDLLFLCTAFQVFVFSMSNGLLLRTIGSIGKRDGQFLQAVAVAVHPTEDLVYVVDRFHSRVQVFDLEGTFVRKWGVRGESPGEFIEPSGIAIHPTRDLIFISDADTRAHNVQAFQADGTFLYRWGGFGNTPGKFNTPRHLVLHPNRSLLLVADFRNNRVQTFDLNGTFVGQFGGMGSGPEQFMAICGLAVDPTHELVYVADEDNKRVSVFSL